jgi:magnesium-transporting ATPase (P-type)
MANVSVVCTDKTGILTQNVMTVVAGSVGTREVRLSFDICIRRGRHAMIHRQQIHPRKQVV